MLSENTLRQRAKTKHKDNMVSENMLRRHVSDHTVKDENVSTVQSVKKHPTSTLTSATLQDRHSDYNEASIFAKNSDLPASISRLWAWAVARYNIIETCGFVGLWALLERAIQPGQFVCAYRGRKKTKIQQRELEYLVFVILSVCAE